MLKNVEKRFDEKISWIYDELQLDPSEYLHENRAYSPAKHKADMTTLRTKCFAMVAVSKCVHAKEKDEDNYPAEQFRRCLEETIASGLKISRSLLEKYMERDVSIKVAVAKNTVETSWVQICNLVDLAPANMETVRNDIENWCESCFDADLFDDWASSLHYPLDNDTQKEPNATQKDSTLETDLEDLLLNNSQNSSSNQAREGLGFLAKLCESDAVEDEKDTLLQELQEKLILDNMCTALAWSTIFVRPEAKDVIEIGDEDEDEDEEEEAAATDDDDKVDWIAKRWEDTIAFAQFHIGERLIKTAATIKMKPGSATAFAEEIEQFLKCFDNDILVTERATLLTKIEKKKHAALEPVIKSPIGQHMVSTLKLTLKQHAQEEKGFKKVVGPLMENYLCQTCQGASCINKFLFC